MLLVVRSMSWDWWYRTPGTHPPDPEQDIPSRFFEPGLEDFFDVIISGIHVQLYEIRTPVSDQICNKKTAHKNETN